MAKKQKQAPPKRTPTKRQLSRWQRQAKIRRIVIIAAVVFLVGILSWVGIGYYEDYRERTAIWREAVLEVNDTFFTMEYYAKMFDAYTKGMEPDQVRQVANSMAPLVANQIIEAEVQRQGAKELGIEVTRSEIDAGLEENEFPDNEAYRDIISASLFRKKLREHDDFQPPEPMNQAHVQVMFVESEEVANKVMAEIDSGGNFTALVDEFSHHPRIRGDLGWLPEELMPNTLIADVAFNLTPGELSEPIYDETTAKNVGYWIIEVIAEVEDEREVRAMLLGSRVEAEQIKDKLAAGDDFGELAEEHSQHESKDDGGELGWLERGDMESDAFDDVAFTLAPGVISEPVKDESVQTTGGYWLIDVVDREERELEDGTKGKLIDRLLNEWLGEQKEKSTIENHLDQDKIDRVVRQVLRRR